MKSKLFLLFILLQSLFYTSCSQKTSCDKLSNNFTTYDKAVIEIKSTDFKIEESVNTSKSSWIKGASFYSCDGNTGFYILQTDKKEYLYTNMPYSVWTEFKNAESLGKFYNENIKHRYIFQLTK